MRFVVPILTVHAGPNPKYFGQLKGVTWHNLLSDQFTGLNAIPTQALCVIVWFCWRSCSNSKPN